MSDNTKTTSKRRAPRAFNLDDREDSKTQSEKTDAPSTKPTKRKPRSFDTSAKAAPKLKEIPDEAAQRSTLDPISHEDLAAELTPPPPPALTARRRRFSWGRVFWIALTGLVTLAVGVWVDELLRECC